MITDRQRAMRTCVWALALALAAGVPSAGAAPSPAGDCDRACLEGYVDRSRDDATGKRIEAFGNPRAPLTTAIPAAEHMSRILEIFKIESGLIAEIEALLIRAPYGMPSGWSTPTDAMSDAARDVTGFAP